MGIEFDYREVTALAKTLDEAAGGPAMKDVEKVVFRGAIQIKKDAQRRLKGNRHLRRLPYAIDFDMYQSLRGPAAEIGANRGKVQGKLANVAEYGTINNTPTPFMGPAADAEAPKFAKAIEDLAVKALEP
jgi:hypothetical protein